MEKISKKKTIGANEIILETGHLAKQANGAVVLDINGTVVLATACMTADAQEEKDFFPLIVDYQERTYAAGKIPGGFFKKEGRPKEAETLTARVVDRSIRPLFPDGMRNGVQVICSVISSDGQNDPDVQAVNAASAALVISDIPFDGPISCVRVGRVDGNFVVNPTHAQREQSDLDVIVSGTKDKVVMIETKAKQLDEATVTQALKFGHEHVRLLIDLQMELKAAAGKEKAKITYFTPAPELVDTVRAKSLPALETIFNEPDKIKTAQLRRQHVDTLVADMESDVLPAARIKSAFEVVEKKFIRNKILREKIRPDGRQQTQIRPISASVSMLPRTHGSSLFTRGQTQAMAVATLGTKEDSPLIEDLTGKSYKRFFLHYSFPPYSVGEVAPIRSSSRREIGHGALAEKAVDVVMPGYEKFPYTIRLVSEILESNGSSSMASVCAATMALMDAGVPIEHPVAGIAMGLVTDGDDFIVLTDIQGAEDHSGDMDFKVAGTRNGITAIQLDIKIDGLDYRIIEETLAKARDARLHLLDIMEQAISEPRPVVSQYAPKIVMLDINPDKIGELIGPGGKVIRRIQSEAGVEIEIDDDVNKVTVFSVSQESLDKGVQMVRDIIQDVEIGKTYDAIVRKIMAFGAFCDISSNKSGLVHVSELKEGFVKEVTDVVKEGDQVRVKVIGIDEQGRINLSMRQADKEGAPEPLEKRPPRQDRGDRGDRGGREHRDHRGDRGDRGGRQH